MTAAFKYVGSGDYLEGVPARDLADDEFAALGADRQADVQNCGLYEPVSVEPAGARSKPVTSYVSAPAVAPLDEKGEG